MNIELIKQSVAIFNTQDKWDALFEIHNQTAAIINDWLEIGAKALRASFSADSDWKCEMWVNKRDSRWYLKEFGNKSIGIGFGWKEIELHLHLLDSPPFSYQRAAELLATEEFRPLLELFELKTPPKYVNDGGLAYDITFNPFSGATDIQVRQREFAWIAAHQTDEYVDKMGAIIRQLTDNSTYTALFRELNLKSRSE